MDFGGGIGTHALAASCLSNVEHVWFVDLNPQNRCFVEQRAKQLGVENQISIYRDLEKFLVLKRLDMEGPLIPPLLESFQ